MLKTQLLSFFLLLIFSANSFAGTCAEKFSWLPNEDSDAVTGYRIYYGSVDMGPYPNMIEVIDTTVVNGRIYATVHDLECGFEYHFVCVAYNSFGESNNSLQVTVVAGQGDFPWILFWPAILNHQR